MAINSAFIKHAARRPKGVGHQLPLPLARTRPLPYFLKGLPSRDRPRAQMSWAEGRKVPKSYRLAQPSQVLQGWLSLTESPHVARREHSYNDRRLGCDLPAFTGA